MFDFFGAVGCFGRSIVQGISTIKDFLILFDNFYIVSGDFNMFSFGG